VRLHRLCDEHAVSAHQDPVVLAMISHSYGMNVAAY
jgi:hypothetical protein